MKQFLLLCALMFTTPLLGSGIDAGETSAPCDNATLETYGGTANVEINWEPNTIQTRWYNGNTLIDTTNTNADSCVYDDVLNRPTNPTRTGYTFNGWTLRPEMDFGIININGVGVFYAKGMWKDKDYCYHIRNTGSAEECETDNNYHELQQNEWKVILSEGILYGMSGCSTTNGTYPYAGTPVIGSGQYCWCKATGWKPVGTTIINSSLSVLPWVFVYDDNYDEHCMQICAHDCAVMTSVAPALRSALFTPASNN